MFNKYLKNRENNKCNNKDSVTEQSVCKLHESVIKIISFPENNRNSHTHYFIFIMSLFLQSTVVFKKQIKIIIMWRLLCKVTSIICGNHLTWPTCFHPIHDKRVRSVSYTHLDVYKRQYSHNDDKTHRIPRKF